MAVGSAPGFADREAAGRRLAEALRDLDGPDPVELGLPRGGPSGLVEVPGALEEVAETAARWFHARLA